MKINVIYWSGTGNTEMMAEAIADGAREQGAEVSVINVADATAEDASDCDALALGSPSMGMEVLEESEFEPYFDEIEESLSGKKVLLFGSYDWGDGQWMRDWVDRLEDHAELINEGLIINLTPDEEGIEKCKEAGAKLAE